MAACSGREYLYLLLWHDTLERLDTLILEIRHLQVSIIHNLRVPELYRVLRKEEFHLWGRDWPTRREKDYSISTLAAELANEWMPAFPNSDGIACRSLENDESSVVGRADALGISQIVSVFLREASWAVGQRLNYSYLANLQKLKRQIFADKMVLSMHALEWGIGQPESVTRKPDKAKFIILRDGVNKRAADYILQLRNFQNAFNKTMDMGLQDHPRPSIERRRELGIYSEYLEQRSWHLFRDMDMLLDKLDTPKFRSTTEVFHRWRHYSTSSVHSFEDQVESVITRISEKRAPMAAGKTVSFVNTSYFMPERPDLQPVIAHEVAHLLIRDRFDDLSDLALASAKDSFSDLILTMQGVISGMCDWPGLPRTDLVWNHLVREITADLLALSVKGFGYLYALALEIVGFETDKLLRRTGRSVDLAAIDELKGATPVLSHSRTWYIRLRVGHAWMAAIHHRHLCALDKGLLDGIHEICEEVNAFLVRISTNREPERNKAWTHLAEQLCDAIGTSEAVQDIKAWRIERSNDDRTEDNKKGECWFPRSTARLDDDVRDLLHEIHLGMKNGKHRGLEGVPLGCLERGFRDYYGVFHRRKAGFGYPNKAPGDGSDSLYRHVYDIPWQCAFKRAMDVMGGVRGCRLTGPESLLAQLHFDFPIGRELFGFALEFYLWDLEPATHRLADAVRIIGQAWADASTDPEVVELLHQWVGDPVPDEPQKQRELAGLAQAEAARKGRLERRTAQEVLEVARCWQTIARGDHRWTERIAGQKLEDLLVRLEDKFGTLAEVKLSVPIAGFVNYLAIRRSADKAYQRLSKKSFFETLGKAFTRRRYDPNSVHTPVSRSLTELMLGRICTGGSYATTAASNPGAYRKVAEVLRSKWWRAYFSANGEAMESATSVALGRYDAVMWGETRPLCRCPLPVFDKDLRLSRAEEDARRERFPTFFTRREMGFRFTLKGRWPKWAGFPKQEPVAFLAITLQRRSFRLSFLARLLYEIQEEWDVRGGHFGGMGSKFAKGDFGFLTDGWGDLVLVFGRGHPDRGAKRRLLEVFEVQEALYQDFMVDRTELILTPAAVDAALSDKNRWLVRTQARLLESRTAGRENDDFRAHVKKMSSRDNVQKVLSPIEVYRTPGRMDFALLMQSDGPKPVVDGFDAIMDLMDHESVDRVDTMIAKREEQEHETLRRGWRDPRKEPFGGRARWMKKARG